MAWIESHSSLEKHHKLIRLQTAMRWSRNETVGFLHRFWWTVMEVSPTGDVTSLSLPEVMSEMLNMKVDVIQEVLRVMKEVGFLIVSQDKSGDRILVNDWLTYAGYYLKNWKFRRDKKGYENVKKLHGYRRKSVSRQSPDSLPKVFDNQPNQTNQTKPKNMGAKPPPVSSEPKVQKPPGEYKISTPGQEIVACYKLLKGIPMDDRQWDRTYYPRFRKSAEALLKFFGDNVEESAECLEGVAKWAEKSRLDWTLETAIKRAADWKYRRLRE